jgi:ferredoxin
MVKAKKAAFISKECVACGTCIKVCPLHALSIYKGTIAVVDLSKCVGCGKCAKVCPANVIIVQEVTHEEKTLA